MVTETIAGLSVVGVYAEGKVVPIGPGPAVITDKPGSKPRVCVRLENTTDVWREFRVDVIGLKTEESPTIEVLEPRAQKDVSLLIPVPGTMASGCHKLAIRASLYKHGRDENERRGKPGGDPDLVWYAELELKVADGRQASITLEPASIRVRRAAKTEVTIRNRADVELDFQLRAVDPEDVVRIKFPGTDVQRDSSGQMSDGFLTVLPDGSATKTARLSIGRSKRRLFGEPVPRVLDIVAEGSGAFHSTTLRVEQRPFVAMWFVKAVATVVALVVFTALMLALVRAVILDNPTPKWAELAESPLSARGRHTATWVELADVERPDRGFLSRGLKSVQDFLWREDGFTEAMIVWGGGTDGEAFGDGALYSVAADRWSEIEEIGAPSPRLGHTATWTGTRMIVWGGRSTPLDMPPRILDEEERDLFLGDGGAYSPSTDTWDPDLVPTNLNIDGRHQHTAVWTEYGMIVWGGANEDDFFNDGWIYCDEDAEDPCSPEAGWTKVGDPLEDSGLDPEPCKPKVAADCEPPSPRAGHIAVWTGQEMIIWGGYDQTGPLNDGAAFDPRTNEWRALAPLSWFEARAFAEAVWTGDDVLMLGGVGAGELARVAEAQLALASELGNELTPEDIARRSGLSIDTVARSLEILEAGYDTEAAFERQRLLDNTVALYEPQSDSWMSGERAPPKTSDPTLRWTGERLRLVFGVPSVDTITSISWVPGEDWDRLPLPATDEVIPSRTGHTVVWFGGGLVVWGGRATSDCVEDGGCFLNGGGLLPIGER